MTPPLPHDPHDGTPAPAAPTPDAGNGCPRLRDEIDVQPAGPAEPGLFVLHDATGLSPARLAVSRAALRLALAFDGRHTLLDLRDRFLRERAADGPVPTVAEILALADALDDALFLDSPRFADHRDRCLAAFRDQPVRAAISSGVAYPADPDELRSALRRWMVEAPPPEESDLRAAPGPADRVRAPRGVLVPHLDFARGHAAYGQLYRELSERRAPATVYVAGVAHRPLTRGCCALCAKDFATPLGTVAHDAEAVRRLADRGRAVGADWLAEAHAHATEHSVELQTPWLRALWPSARIVPLLADDRPDRPAAPDHPGEWTALARALARVAAEEDALLLASVDLDHAGPCFDPDDPELTGERLDEIETRDRAYLARVAAGDADAARRLLREQGPRRRICGEAVIHLLGCALPGVRGRLLGYHQAVDDDGGQAVTFAALVFE